MNLLNDGAKMAVEIIYALKLIYIILDCLLHVALCFRESIFFLSNGYTAEPAFLKLAYQGYYAISVHQILLKSSLIRDAPYRFIQLLYAIKPFNLFIFKSFI